MKMIALTRWATRHRAAARILLVLLHLSIFLLSIHFGLLLESFECFLPWWVIPLAVPGLVAANLYYPIRHRTPLGRNQWLRRRRIDLAVVVGCFLIGATWIQEPRTGPSYSSQTTTAIATARFVVHQENPRAQAEETTVRKGFKQWLRESFRKKSCKNIYPEYVHPTGERIVYSILLLALACLLGFGVLAFACSVLCNTGSVAIYYTILGLGWMGVLLIVVPLLKKVWAKF